MCSLDDVAYNHSIPDGGVLPVSNNEFDHLNTFFQGAIVPVPDSKVSVMTHALHYGTAVFEGIRGNWNEEQGVISIFRLREHYDRLLRGCKLLMLDIPLSLIHI